MHLAAAALCGAVGTDCCMLEHLWARSLCCLPQQKLELHLPKLSQECPTACPCPPHVQDAAHRIFSTLFSHSCPFPSTPVFPRSLHY